MSRYQVSCDATSCNCIEVSLFGYSLWLNLVCDWVEVYKWVNDYDDWLIMWLLFSYDYYVWCFGLLVATPLLVMMCSLAILCFLQDSTFYVSFGIHQFASPSRFTNFEFPLRSTSYCVSFGIHKISETHFVYSRGGLTMHVLLV